MKGPEDWPRRLHSEAQAMHEDIEGGQIYDRPPLPCCLADKEQTAVKARVSGAGSIAPLFRSSCTDWFGDDHLKDPKGYVVSCPWSLSGGSVTKGILYPHCTMRMTQGSAPISDQAPENFDSLPAIFSGDWTEVCTVNGGTSGAFMHAGVRTSGTFRPFLLHGLFPYGRTARRKGLCPWI